MLEKGVEQFCMGHDGATGEGLEHTTTVLGVVGGDTTV